MQLYLYTFFCDLYRDVCQLQSLIHTVVFSIISDWLEQIELVGIYTWVYEVLPQRYIFGGRSLSSSRILAWAREARCKLRGNSRVPIAYIMENNSLYVNRQSRNFVLVKEE